MNSANCNFLDIVCESIIRGTDSRTKRYYVFSREQTFLRDMCDYVGTYMMIRSAMKAGSIADEQGSIFSIQSYPILESFHPYLKTGEVYLLESGIERTTPLFKANFNAEEFEAEVIQFYDELSGSILNSKLLDENGEYHYHLMSPNRMRIFLEDIKAETSLVKLDFKADPIALDAFDVVADESGCGHLVGGSVVSSEWSLLSGFSIPNCFGEYLRRVDVATREECLSCVTKAMFSSMMSTE